MKDTRLDSFDNLTSYLVWRQGKNSREGFGRTSIFTTKCKSLSSFFVFLHVYIHPSAYDSLLPLCRQIFPGLDGGLECPSPLSFPHTVLRPGSLECSDHIISLPAQGASAVFHHLQNKFQPSSLPNSHKFPWLGSILPFQCWWSWTSVPCGQSIFLTLPMTRPWAPICKPFYCHSLCLWAFPSILTFCSHLNSGTLGPAQMTPLPGRLPDRSSPRATLPLKLLHSVKIDDELVSSPLFACEWLVDNKSTLFLNRGTFLNRAFCIKDFK